MTDETPDTKKLAQLQELEDFRRQQLRLAKDAQLRRVAARRPIFEKATKAGFRLALAGPLPAWWPELAPLTPGERKILRHEIELRANPAPVAQELPGPPGDGGADAMSRSSTAQARPGSDLEKTLEFERLATRQADLKRLMGHPGNRRVVYALVFDSIDGAGLLEVYEGSNGSEAFRREGRRSVAKAFHDRLEREVPDLLELMVREARESRDEKKNLRETETTQDDQSDEE